MEGLPSTTIIRYVRPSQTGLEVVSLESFTRGILGLGVTLLVVAAAMATVNGLARGWASKQLANNPDDQNAAAILMLF